MIWTTLRQFIDGHGRSGGERVYSQDHHMMLYVYRHRWMTNGLRIGVMDIPERHQKQGHMTRLLQELDHMALRIENVSNTYLENHLLRKENWFCEDLGWVGIGSTFHNLNWKVQLDDHHSQNHLR